MKFSFEKPIGRSTYITKIIRTITSGEKVTNIFGTMGIGKSTVCYAILEKLQNKNFYIFPINARGCYTFELFFSNLLNIFNCPNSQYSKNILFHKLAELSNYNKTIIYIDNFEDCLLDNRISNFIFEIAKLNINILLSSRTILEGAKNVKLNQLSDKFCLSLFINTAKRNGHFELKDRNVLLDFIKTNLDSHTLSIKIVASKAYLYNDEDGLINDWLNIKSPFLGDKTNNLLSLSLSVQNFYDQIKNDTLSIFIWCCFILFPDEIKYEIFEQLFKEDINSARNSLQILIKHNVIEQKNGGYYVLQPIRKIILEFTTLQNIKIADKDPIKTVLLFYINKFSDKSIPFSDISYILVFLVKNNFYNYYRTEILKLLQLYKNSFSTHVFMVLPIFEMLENLVDTQKINFSKKFLYSTLADLYHFTGDNTKALHYYKKIRLSSKNSFSKNDVRILRKQCEIYRLFGNREMALEQFQKAYEIACKNSYVDEMVGLLWQKSEIYRLIDHNYSKSLDVLLETSENKIFINCKKINDVYWSLGEIYYKKRQIRNSRKYFNMALKGYTETQNILGLSYTLLSLAQLNQNLKDCNSMELFEKAKDLFEKADYYLGVAHCYFYIAKFIIKINPKHALENFNIAFNMYKSIGYLEGIKKITIEIKKLHRRDSNNNINNNL